MRETLSEPVDGAASVDEDGTASTDDVSAATVDEDGTAGDEPPPYGHCGRR